MCGPSVKYYNTFRSIQHNCIIDLNLNITKKNKQWKIF